MVEIYAVNDELGEWDEGRIKEILPNAAFLVYNYEEGDYDGSGMAIWKIGRKYGYQYLGHCSCYGPLEDLKNHAEFTLAELQKLAKSADYHWGYAKPVLAKVAELNKRKTA